MLSASIPNWMRRIFGSRPKPGTSVVPPTAPVDLVTETPRATWERFTHYTALDDQRPATSFPNLEGHLCRLRQQRGDNRWSASERLPIGVTITIVDECMDFTAYSVEPAPYGEFHGAAPFLLKEKHGVFWYRGQDSPSVDDPRQKTFGVIGMAPIGSYEELNLHVRGVHREILLSIANCLTQTAKK